MRRADIPFWFTEGFNPRPFLTFAAPLSLGTAGMCEVVDIKLVEDMPYEEITRRMNGALPEGLRIIRVAEPVKSHKLITASRYDITIEKPEGCEDLCEKLCCFLSQPEIKVQKLNKKKKYVETEIKQYVKSFDAAEEKGAVVLHIVLSTGCVDNCNPSLVLEAFRENIGVDKLNCNIVRLGILDDELKPFE